MAVTWNPNDKNNINLSDDNLTAWGVIFANGTVRATESRSSGKWYWEIQYHHGSDAYTYFGVATSSHDITKWIGSTSDSHCFRFESNGGAQKWHNNVGEDYGSSLADGDIVMIALDLDNGKIWWGKNGTWFGGGDPAAGTNPAYTNVLGEFYPAASFYHDTTKQTAKFHSQSLAYSPPSGFQPLEGGEVATHIIYFNEEAGASDSYDTTMGYTKTIEEGAAVSDTYDIPAPVYMTFAEAATVSERYDFPSPIYTEIIELSSVEDAYAPFALTAVVEEEAAGVDAYATNLRFATGEDGGLVQDHWEFTVARKASPVDSYIGHVGSSPTVDVTKGPIIGDATVDIAADAAGLGGAVLSEGIEVSCKATASQVIVAQGVASAALSVEALGAGFAEATTEVDVDATGCVSTLGSAIAELLLSMGGEASAEIRGEGNASIVSHISAAGHSEAVAEGQADVIVGLKATGVIGKLATGECTLQLAVEGSGAPVPTGEAEAEISLGLQATARTNIGVCVLRYTR
ncbi:MAG: hypothetical protein DRJ03_27900 [Chloroflexi bacterium]|nr:MAG: hypothetical protein DRJ03_27900 [Chloroflexota bacterium]